MQQSLLALLLAAIATGSAHAQALSVGEMAPSFELEAWSNLASGEKSPSPETLKSSVVLIEFWGTWCAPCVRAMPRIQALHDRLKDKGLKVLAISYEAADVIEPFAKSNGYTFVLGSDPTKRVVEAYGVRSWPTSVVIGKDGRIAHVGSPYDVEPALEKALGLETSPTTLLTAALNALASKDKKRIDADVGRIAEKESLELDLKAWALAAGGSAKADGAAGKDKDFDAQAELERLAQAWGDKDAGKKQALLDRLAAQAPAAFDAVPWAKRVRGRELPITKAEFAALLKAQRFDEAVDALYLRNPPGEVVAAAARDKALKEHCAKKAASARTEAKKGLMCQDFLFSERHPKDNDGFWAELAVSGARTSTDKKEITGVLLGDGDATPSNVAFYVERHLARAFLMESLAAGKAPVLAGLADKVAKERDQIRKTLERKYGGGP
jgi:peroxiredoxin